MRSRGRGATQALPQVAATAVASLALAGTAGLAMANPMTVAARSDAPPARTSFAGSCELSGVVRFAPALTTSSVNGTVQAAASGFCSGTLTSNGGVRTVVRRAPVQAVAQSSGSESCAFGRGRGAG